MIIIYHIYAKNDWTEKLVNLQLQRLIDSGLYDRCTNIICTILNHNQLITNNISEKLKLHNKIIYDISDKLKLYEGATFINCQRHIASFSDDTPLLYIHTKCGSRGEDANNHEIYCNHWRNMMEHCVIDRWKTCIDKLKSYDSCFPLTMGGNFFWTTRKLFLINIQTRIEKFTNQDRFHWEFMRMGNTFFMVYFHFDFYHFLLKSDFYKIDDTETIDIICKKSIANDQIRLQFFPRDPLV
jgi:hypothetical protein